MYQGETDRTGQGKKMGVSKYAGVFTYVCMFGFLEEGDSFFVSGKGRIKLESHTYWVGWG